jgi:hypothetical protein
MVAGRLQPPRVFVARLQVCGVFDHEGAAWADRHHDFRYLAIERQRGVMLEISAA